MIRGIRKTAVLYTLFSCTLFPVFTGCSDKTEQVDLKWPEITTEAKPWTRWWWMGNAVDKANLSWNLEQMQAVGFGGVEITPIYGVQGADSLEIPYLSPEWMNLLAYSMQEGERLGLKTDLSNGTGWPFGGPDISTEDAATKACFKTYTLDNRNRLKGRILPDDKIKDFTTLSVLMAYGPDKEKLDITNKYLPDGTLDWTPASPGRWQVIALFNSKTRQKVKRPAPGGEGFVMNHFSDKTLSHYLNRFDEAFTQSGVKYPNTFFNDSYEVYGADWTEDLFAGFEKRRGYKLQDFLPELLRQTEDTDLCSRVVSDYRETLSEMLLHNFTEPWTEWAHSKGALTRNQAHGSPGNLIDLYAAVDIPECELWSTAFNIPALRYDSCMKPGVADPTGLKFSSSAAHIAGKQYTSSETFTWLTEHFRTSLSQCKPMLDMMFISGVNHVYFHGTPYTQQDAAWPGWLFYASVNFSPFNTIWKDLGAMNEYIARCQSFLQYGRPDNEVLLYFPIYDYWYQEPGLFLPFHIDKFGQYTTFHNAVTTLRQEGYDIDYVSDRFIREAKVEKGRICLPGGRYKTLLIPSCNRMPVETMESLLALKKQGASIHFMGNVPADVPGYSDWEQRRERLQQLVGKWDASGDKIEDALPASGVVREKLTTHYHIQYIRRQYDKGHIYFLTMLDNKRIDGWIPLGVKARSALCFDPLTGESGKIPVRVNEGKAEVYLQITSGKSLILKTFDKVDVATPGFPLYEQVEAPCTLNGNWTFEFADGIPNITGSWQMEGNPVPWTTLPVDSAEVFAGTGRYTCTFDKPDVKADDYILNLGDLGESAHVYINGEDAGKVWSIPYTLRVGKYLKDKENRIQIDVTNLPFNRIRSYDKKGIRWRMFKDINIVNVNYDASTYDSWPLQPSGLLAPVQLVPVRFVTIFAEIFKQ